MTEGRNAGRRKALKKVAYHNLGCKVNSYELDVMKQLLEERGYETVDFGQRADLYVVNTCTVTNIADRKSRQMLHRAKKMNPDALVIAVGCYVETDKDRVLTDPAIDLAIGNNKKGQIAQILDRYLASLGQEGKEISSPEISGPGKLLGGDTMEDLSLRPQYEDMQLKEPGHTRAYIKIQDGCNQFCSYCIIPFARGRIRSRKPEEILREIEALSEKGIREVVLTGIHVSSYGLEWDTEGVVRFDPVKSGRALYDLLSRIQQVPGIERIRLSSLEPRIMTEEFVQKISGLSKLCPHFHLSLQSGCDATLKRMNRHYSAEEYLENVKRLRRYFDRPAVTTDVIVGFPGETEEEFAATRAFLEEVSFYEIHVFKYSVRKGTIAAKMKGQVPETVKGERSDILLSLTKAQAWRYRESFSGQEEEVLLEERVLEGTKEYWSGHTKRYVRCLVPAEGDLQAGDLCRVRILAKAPGSEAVFAETI
jgi:threonylcarbamoyladenosine tRNA methylthiotransferase MtaB